MNQRTMDHRDPAPNRTLRWQRPAVLALAATLAIALAHALDPLVLAFLPGKEPGEQDWQRALRALGSIPTWLVIAIAFVLIDWPTNRWRRGSLVLSASLLSGVLAEALKLLLRRRRPPGDPELHELGEWPGYLFRTFTDQPFSTSGLGLPSSHAAVAFGGMLMLCYLHPRASVLWIALALGTGATRVHAEAHYLSDVVVAAAVAWAAVRLLVLTDRPRNPPPT